MFSAGLRMDLAEGPPLRSHALPTKTSLQPTSAPFFNGRKISSRLYAQRQNSELGALAQACNPNTREAEADIAL